VSTGNRCGSNSVGRVTAFQAVGRGFESRLPLNEVGSREFPACVAQLVEHVLGKDEVTGSIPVASSNRASTVNKGYCRERSGNARVSEL
jgi:hypothetical protein